MQTQLLSTFLRLNFQPYTPTFYNHMSARFHTHLLSDIQFNVKIHLHNILLSWEVDSLKESYCFEVHWKFTLSEFLLDLCELWEAGNHTPQ